MKHVKQVRQMRQMRQMRQVREGRYESTRWWLGANTVQPAGRSTSGCSEVSACR